jgi:SAM-dependent methyltransferase
MTKNQLKENIRNILLKYLLPNKYYLSVTGHCPCCDSDVIFESYNSWLRDNLICKNCASIPRERALMLTIEKYYPNWRNLNIHETSPCKRGASLKLKQECENYISTQYYPNKIFGELIEGHRNEDLENQTLQSSSFDLVISQDVMEHIYDPEKAFSEIARTLKKGGAHIFTVPIINKHRATEIWAIKNDNGEPVFLKTPEYHGNPVDPKGSPVTMHWGYDITDFIEKTSELKTNIEYINDLRYGVQAEYIEVLVSQKQ